RKGNSAVRAAAGNPKTAHGTLRHGVLLHEACFQPGRRLKLHVTFPRRSVLRGAPRYLHSASSCAPALAVTSTPVTILRLANDAVLFNPARRSVELRRFGSVHLLPVHRARSLP